MTHAYEPCEVVYVNFHNKKIVERRINMDNTHHQMAYDVYMKSYNMWKNTGIETMVHKESVLLAMQHPYCDIKLHHAYAIKLEEKAKLEYSIAEDFLKRAELEALHAVC